jgi:hypothetical protein
MRRDRKPLVAARSKSFLSSAPPRGARRVHCTHAGLKGVSGSPSPVGALQMGSQERMAGFPYPRQEGGPGTVVATRQGGSGAVVRATDIPPIRRDLPDEPQPRGGLQRGRPSARTGGIEARLCVLLGRPALAVCSRRECRLSSIPCHAALIAKNSLSGSVVPRRDSSRAGRSVDLLLCDDN